MAPMSPRTPKTMATMRNVVSDLPVLVPTFDEPDGVVGPGGADDVLEGIVGEVGPGVA